MPFLFWRYHHIIQKQLLSTRELHIPAFIPILCHVLVFVENLARFSTNKTPGDGTRFSTMFRHPVEDLLCYQHFAQTFPQKIRLAAGILTSSVDSASVCHKFSTELWKTHRGFLSDSVGRVFGGFSTVSVENPRLQSTLLSFFAFWSI